MREVQDGAPGRLIHAAGFIRRNDFPPCPRGPRRCVAAEFVQRLMTPRAKAFCRSGTHRLSRIERDEFRLFGASSGNTKRGE